MTVSLDEKTVAELDELWIQVLLTTVQKLHPF